MYNYLYLLLDATSAADSSAASKNGWLSWIFLPLVIVIFGGMMVYSYFQRKKQEKQMNEKLEGLKVGDKVETIGRIYGTIVAVHDEENAVVLLTGDEQYPSYVKVDKMAIYRTINDPVAETEENTEETAKEESATETAAEETAKEETAENAQEETSENAPENEAEENK